MNRKLVLFCTLALVACSSLHLEAVSERGLGKSDAGASALPDGTIREVVGQIVIDEGQQGKADAVTVKTDLASYRIKPAPILNDLLNFAEEMRFRFYLERAGEGNEEVWQIVRYVEIRSSSASQAIGPHPGRRTPGGSESPSGDPEGSSPRLATPPCTSGKEPSAPGSCRPVPPARKSGRRR